MLSSLGQPFSPKTKSISKSDKHAMLKSELTPKVLFQLKLLMGLEPMTSSLPRKCSTTELQQQGQESG